MAIFSCCGQTSCRVSRSKAAFLAFGKSILDQIFAGISDLDHQNEPVVVTAGPGTETPIFGRARVLPMNYQ